LPLGSPERSSYGDGLEVTLGTFEAYPYRERRFEG